jgi:predicted transcriptional regulator
MSKKSISSIVQELGGTGAVADLCHVSSQAVSQWIAKEKIPQARLLFLQLLKPEVFEEEEQEQEAA